MPVRSTLNSRSLKTAYLLCYLLNAPLFALYSIMVFILHRDLSASVVLITTLVAVKPIVAVLSSYWSDYFSVTRGRIKANIIGAMLLGLAPTFFFPFFNNGWLLVAAFTIYFFAERAEIPAWMELIKVSLPKSEQSRIVSRGSLISFVVSAGFPLLICPLLDCYHHAWRWMFPALGAMSFMRLPILLSLLKSYAGREKMNISYSQSLISPWKNSFELLLSRPDFAYYQAIFFCGGLGLMIMQPCLPQIVQNNLHLSYTQIATAVALCKGLGFAATNSIWASKLYRTNIFKYCGLVTLFAMSSIILIFFSRYWSFSIYMAFVLYGVMQAGSQLSWQLGGPIFSPDQDSSRYTSVNIMLVGLRGCVGPAIGGLFFAQFGPFVALLVGGLFCFLGSCLGYFGSSRVKLGERPKGL